MYTLAAPPRGGIDQTVIIIVASVGGAALLIFVVVVVVAICCLCNMKGKGSKSSYGKPGRRGVQHLGITSLPTHVLLHDVCKFFGYGKLLHWLVPWKSFCHTCIHDS